MEARRDWRGRDRDEEALRRSCHRCDIRPARFPPHRKGREREWQGRRRIDDEPGLEPHDRGLQRTLARRHGRLRDQRRRTRRAGSTRCRPYRCYQDVNGDGCTSGRTMAETSCTPRCGRRTRSSPSAAAAPCWFWIGGDAERWAVLYARGWKGGVESTRFTRVGRLPRGGLS